VTPVSSSLFRSRSIASSIADFGAPSSVMHLSLRRT
jgi:hypothetical protein